MVQGKRVILKDQTLVTTEAFYQKVRTAEGVTHKRKRSIILSFDGICHWSVLELIYKDSASIINQTRHSSRDGKLSRGALTTWRISVKVSQLCSLIQRQWSLTFPY